MPCVKITGDKKEDRVPRQIQTFEVSLKAFIVRDGRLLLVRESDTGYWELPGGRIDVGEEWEQHATVLAREIREELGASFEIEPGREVITWVRQRPVDGVFQFAVGRICRYTRGAAQLSDEHDRLLWAGPADWQDLRFPENSNYPDALQRFWQAITGG